MGQRVSAGSGHVPAEWADPTGVLFETKLVSSTPGHLYQIIGSNEALAARYVQVFNRSALPPAGNPLISMRVESGASFSIDLPRGKKFSVGIVVAASTTGATYTASGTADLLASIEFERSNPPGKTT